MGEKSSRTSRIAAFVLLSVNLLSMTLCILMFAVSIWMISSPSSLSSALHGFGNPTVKALFPREALSVQSGLALACISGFLILVCFMAVYGALARSPFLLFMYSILVLLLLLLECALLYYFSSGLQEKGLQDEDGQWTHALRLAFQCCEYNTSSSGPVQRRLPWSCCGAAEYPDNCTITKVYNMNCHQTISHWIHRYQTVVYTSLAALHIILSSCSLMRRSRGVPSISYS